MEFTFNCFLADRTPVAFTHELSQEALVFEIIPIIAEILV